MSCPADIQIPTPNCVVPPKIPGLVNIPTPYSDLCDPYLLDFNTFLYSSYFGRYDNACHFEPQTHDACVLQHRPRSVLTPSDLTLSLRVLSPSLAHHVGPASRDSFSPGESVAGLAGYRQQCQIAIRRAAQHRMGSGTSGRAAHGLGGTITWIARHCGASLPVQSSSCIMNVVC